MKIAHVNYSDQIGGAARAAYRLHSALLANHINSTLVVNQSVSGDWTAYCPKDRVSQTLTGLRPAIGNMVNRLLKTDNPNPRSLAIIPSRWPQRLNHLDCDLLNLHWLNNEMLSIKEIGQLTKPIVWTLHDMWAFCGSEHYSYDDRWQVGYTKQNRPQTESGLDLNRWVWQRKRKYWQNSIHFVTPSHWLANCVKQSALLANFPVTVIPNAIDTDSWQPMDKKLARHLFKLPLDSTLLLFGAIGGSASHIKGFDLLVSALNTLSEQNSDIQLVVFGQSAPKVPLELRLPIHYVGQLRDDLSLQLLYNAVDMLLIPSRLENLPNTGLEALACGKPVVAFAGSGVNDVVTHLHTGYLAQAFDVQDFAQGIHYLLTDTDRYQRICENARQDALTRFTYPVIAKAYTELYETVLTAAKSAKSHV